MSSFMPCFVVLMSYVTWSERLSRLCADYIVFYDAFGTSQRLSHRPDSSVRAPNVAKMAILTAFGRWFGVVLGVFFLSSSGCLLSCNGFFVQTTLRGFAFKVMWILPGICRCVRLFAKALSSPRFVGKGSRCGQDGYLNRVWQVTWCRPRRFFSCLPVVVFCHVKFFSSRRLEEAST